MRVNFYVFPLFIACLLLSSCGRAEQRGINRAQTYLDEAAILNESRRFDRAEEKATEAIKQLQVLMVESPDNFELRLLKSRAYTSLFMSKNIVIMENATVQNESLVRLPKFHEYVNYEETLKLAEENLLYVLNHYKEELKEEHLSYIHASLAGVYRLDTKKLKSADEEYVKALDIYKSSLHRLKNDESKIGNHNLAIARLENTIRSLQMARAEVNLLAKNWPQALDILRSAMAGTDLEFFPVQFEILNGQIYSIHRRMADAEKLRQSSRGHRFLAAIKDKKAPESLEKNAISGSDPYMGELLQTQLYLTDVQNNLLYRIICYYQMQQEPQLEKAYQILGEFFPELRSQTQQLLEEHG